MNYATIKWTDIANGEGVRISLFVSGCTHHCKNCFNEVAWDFAYGEPFTKQVADKILAELKEPYIAGLSLLGGEPLEPQNQEALYPFIKEVKKRYPNKPIWCYTGFVLDEKTGELKETHKNTRYTKKLIALFDVLVDGPFVEELKDIRLKFRGSANQRLIDVQKTLQAGECIAYME
ncbi:MAG: anaerobic ribonucleoside-triphosphate reductase activating protein [Clostridia bacterium]|nr:anaerobic ribonucleoside-triphosphate reductase activating protein [Clostridia bacterium]